MDTPDRRQTSAAAPLPPPDSDQQEDLPQSTPRHRYQLPAMHRWPSPDMLTLWLSEALSSMTMSTSCRPPPTCWKATGSGSWPWPRPAMKHWLAPPTYDPTGSSLTWIWRTRAGSTWRSG